MPSRWTLWTICGRRNSMAWFKRDSNQPLWKEEFSVRTADERYVTRRQLTKFLVLTSLGMFVGNLWILFRSLFQRTPDYPSATVAQLGEIRSEEHTSELQSPYVI